MSAWQHPLGLKVSEYRLILDCTNAYQHASNGHFLPAPRWWKAARRLVDKGYLTLADQLQPGNWPVVKITNENIARYNADLKETRQ